MSIPVKHHVDLGGNRIINAGNPTAAQDLVTRDFVTNGSVLVRNNGSTTQDLTPGFNKLVSALTTVVLNGNNYWDHTNKRLAPGRAGSYLVGGGVQLGNMSNGMNLTLSVRLNGTDYAQVGRMLCVGSTSVQANGSILIPMNVSDYVELFAYNGDVSTRTTIAGAERTFFWALRLHD